MTTTYPRKTEWTYTATNGYRHTKPLSLGWEVNGSSMSDDYYPEETTAAELWRIWLDSTKPVWTDEYGNVPIYWSVHEAMEAAPFQLGHPWPKNFLSYFTWPTHAETGERVNWLLLPVRNGYWNSRRDTKGGFIQELTGWKPSPLQPSVNVVQLARAAGLWLPERLRKRVAA